MPRGAIRTAILVALRDEARSRLRGHAPAGGAERRLCGARVPRLGLPAPADARGLRGWSSPADVDGSRTYTLTESGRAEAEKASLPWQSDDETDDEVRTLRLGVGQLMSAAKQLAGDGEKSQIERGIAVVHRGWKELYQILAED